jgi:hypothetical protein
LTVSLETIFAPFQDRLGADVKFEGPARTDDNAAPPRITWEPATRTHQKPQGLQGSFLTGRWGIRVDIWGKDLSNAVELADRFLAVANELLSRNSLGLGQEVWNTGGATARGTHCVLLVTIDVPILKTAIPSRPITAIDPTYTMGDTQV